MGAKGTCMEINVIGTELRDSAFDVEIPIAGRYRVEVSVKGDAILNIEDYIHNADERNYDITGAMPVDSVDAFVVLQKDGSPLDVGVHNMKININDGDAIVEWIKFTLLKKHELTPYVLKQNLEGDQWALVW